MNEIVVPISVQNILDATILRLNLWSILRNGAVVEGFQMNETGTMMIKVTSEIILRRMTNNMVVDVSGKFFELIGQIDRNFQTKNGMPKEIIDEFINGFPNNWENLLMKCPRPQHEATVQTVYQGNNSVQRVRQESDKPFVTMPEDVSDVREKDSRNNTEREDHEASSSISKRQSDNRQDDEDEGRNCMKQRDPDCTLRAPEAIMGAVTPVAWSRNKKEDTHVRQLHVFDSTPIRSTPKNREPIRVSEFAIPDLPQRRVPSPLAPREERRFDSDDVVDELGEFFGKLEKTPKIATRRLPDMREKSPEYFNRRRNETRHSRDEYDYDDYRGYMKKRPRYENRYEEDENTRYRVNSSRASSRYYDDYNDRRKPFDYHRHSDYSRSSAYSSRYEPDDFDRRSRYTSRYEYDQVEENRRRQRQIEEKLRRKDKTFAHEKSMNRTYKSRKSARSRSDSESDDEDDVERELAKKWAQENEMNDSIDERVERRPKRAKREPEVAKKTKPAKKSAKKREETPELNESLAKNRPKRSTATPLSAYAPPKVIKWAKREVDKLKRILEMKKPSGSDEDWNEVLRLLGKDGISIEEAKKCATNRLKWKEPERDEKEEKKRIEEEKLEEEKRRRGVAAAVKESVRMRDEMMEGELRKDLLTGSVEAFDDIDAGDISADESLLGAGTPLRMIEEKRGKGGKRRTLVPEPVEDSPLCVSRRSSASKSPRNDAAAMKELETTIRYVQNLTTMSGRPSSRANKSYLNDTRNKSRTKKADISIDQGAEKVMKMLRKARRNEDSDEDMDIIPEEDEEDEENDILLAGY
ncbi:unnamed protein product [Caenorhabditis bovis]|uniref:SANTA domain-containing protein n=1 Tax=Caenorhabditis bovis TaxID=2654633 RepID=A0A8S1FA55_9PELO|nr:unnamed protein product [Caenorhabditis bovis]